MGYRTFVNKHEVFCNEYLDEWYEFIKSQGIEVDEDCLYKGYITDVMGAILALERAVERLNKEYEERMSKCGFLNPEYSGQNLFDFRGDYALYLKDKEYDDCAYSSLTDELIRIHKYGYIFLPCNFILACKDKIERDEPYSTPHHLNCYKIKEGCKILVEAR